ncbi:MAG: hypothetical protein P8P36_09305 [Akkermansiaceae bacterium]|nr:hypothetical protein [Akkermansiaceae bacterium]
MANRHGSELDVLADTPFENTRTSRQLFLLQKSLSPCLLAQLAS